MQRLQILHICFSGNSYSKARQTERVGIVQSGEEKAPERPSRAFQYLRKSYKKDGERLSIKERSDGIRGNGFKLKDHRVKLDARKKLFTLRAQE